MLNLHIDIVLFILYLCGNSIGLDGNQIKYSMNPPGEHSVQLVTGGCFFMETKICCNCKVEKSIDQFYKRDCAKDGHAGSCKECSEHNRGTPLPQVINLPNENWLPVIINDGMYADFYMVSNKGRIKSKNHRILNGYGASERVLTLFANPRGYIGLRLCLNGKTRAFVVHRLVATSFISNPENKPHINHKDGVKSNNNVENIEWCTRKENMVHARDMGLLGDHSGENSGRNKLTNEQVLSMRAEYIKFKHQFLNKKYGVSNSQIAAIVSRKTWKHI